MTTPCYYCDIKSVGTCKTCIHSDTYEEPKQPKPLSRQDILEIYSKYKEGVPWLKFAREVESKILGFDGESGEIKSAEVLK